MCYVCGVQHDILNCPTRQALCSQKYKKYTEIHRNTQKYTEIHRNTRYSSTDDADPPTAPAAAPVTLKVVTTPASAPKTPAVTASNSYCHNCTCPSCVAAVNAVPATLPLLPRNLATAPIPPVAVLLAVRASAYGKPTFLSVQPIHDKYVELLVLQKRKLSPT